MTKRTFAFASGTGSQTSGHLETPEGTPRGWAIFAHCFTCGKDSRAAVYISRALSRAGIGVLRFDFAGTGIEGGTGESVNFASDVDDLRAASKAMAAAGMPPSLLIGHSLGGIAAIVAAGDMPDIVAVATIGAPFDPAHSIVRIAGDISTVDEHGTQVLQIEGRGIPISREFLEVLADYNPEVYLSQLRKPLLILHSPTDQTVGIDSAQKIFQVSRYPKSLMSLDRADHLLTRAKSAARAADLIYAWADSYLPEAE